MSNQDIIDSIRTGGHGQRNTFRGVFMRDNLPLHPKTMESGILNLDSSEGGGTHWVCWFKNRDTLIYFDSYGVDPPDELISYLRKPILTSSFKIQRRGSNYCGQLCLFVLKQLYAGKSFFDVIQFLTNQRNTRYLNGVCRTEHS